MAELSLKIATQEHHDKDDDIDYVRAGELTGLLAYPMVLKTAVELDVFGIIARAGPGCQLSAAEIVAQLPVKNPNAASMVDRLLRLLATRSVLACSVVKDENGGIVERKYGLSPLGNDFVPNEDGLRWRVISGVGTFTSRPGFRC